MLHEKNNQNFPERDPGKYWDSYPAGSLEKQFFSFAQKVDY